MKCLVNLNVCPTENKLQLTFGFKSFTMIIHSIRKSKNTKIKFSEFSVMFYSLLANKVRHVLTFTRVFSRVGIFKYLNLKFPM